MTKRYAVYWRQDDHSVWTLVLDMDTMTGAEELKCSIMGKPRGRFIVQRTTVLDFAGSPVPLFVPVGKEQETIAEHARRAEEARKVVPLWKPARKAAPVVHQAPRPRRESEFYPD